MYRRFNETNIGYLDLVSTSPCISSVYVVRATLEGIQGIHNISRGLHPVIL